MAKENRILCKGTYVSVYTWKFYQSFKNEDKIKEFQKTQR